MQNVGSASDLNVTAGYSGYECDAGLPDVIFNNTQYALYCNFGIPGHGKPETDSNLKSVIIKKGNDILFSYKKIVSGKCEKGYIRSREMKGMEYYYEI